MAKYIASFYAESRVRLNVKSYFDGDRHTVKMLLPNATIVLFDHFVNFGSTLLPKGLLIQVALDAQDIDTAIEAAGSFAVGALNILSTVARSSIDRPYLTLAYDVSKDIHDREFVTVVYDPNTPSSTRRPDDAELAEFVEKYDQYHSDSGIPNDHKDRVSRSLDAYRRALADNNDPLTDFIVVWSALEGLDSVYRKTFPTRQAQFKDGMKDVFLRLQESNSFDTLEDLRNEIAHGNMDLVGANHLATSKLELVRKALLLAVMRIIGCSERVINSMLAKNAYKGSFVTRLEIRGALRCQPGDVSSLEGHPRIEGSLNSVTITPNDATFTMRPDIRFSSTNIESYEVSSLKLKGDSGANVRVNDLECYVVKSEDSEV